MTTQEMTNPDLTDLALALDEALWHVNQLQRVIDHKPVGGLAESRAAAKHAYSVLKAAHPQTSVREPS